MSKKVLWPTDFSECSNQALPIAAEWAAQEGGELHLLHAIVLHNDEPLRRSDDFPDDSEVVALLEQASNHRVRSLAGPAPGIVHSSRRGIAAAEVILDYARDEAIDLIVMGTHGRRGPRRLFVGSVTEEVIRKSAAPVLTVRSGSTAKSPADLRRVLLPIDFSDGSKDAIRVAREIVSTSEGHLDLLHVIEQPPYPIFYDAVGDFSQLFPPGLREKVELQLEELYEASEGPTVEHSIHVETGVPGESILAFEAKHASDLIVLMTRGLTGLEFALLGSVAEKIVRRASGEVMVLPERH